MSTEYKEALRAADASSSTASRRALLKIMRVGKVRAPQVVLRHGGALLASWSAASALGDEVWTVREQVLLAALDANDAGTAARQLEALDTKFPGSSRVRRLLGMAHEQRGEFREASEVYADMLLSVWSNCDCSRPVLSET